MLRSLGNSARRLIGSGGYANFPSYSACQLIRLTAPEQAGLVQVHGQACACQLCERPNLEELEARAIARTPWPKTPGMTRAHFAYIARIIAGMDFLADEGMPNGAGGTVKRYVAEEFAYHLADTNPRFDRERFVAAATGL